MSPLRIAVLSVVFAAALAFAATPVRLGLTLSAMPGSTALTEQLDCAQRARARFVMLRAHWPQLQPSASTWNFAPLDAAVEAAQARGLAVVLTLGPSPRWAVRYLTNPGADEAARAHPDLPAMRAYAGALAKHFGDRVYAYELWSPPTGATLLAVPRDVYAMYRTAAAAIHAADSNARVIAPEPGDVNLGWIAAYLASARGSETPDILAVVPRRLATAPDAFWWRLRTLRARVLPADGAPLLWAELPEADASARMAAAALLQDIPGVALSCEAADALPALAAVQGGDYQGWKQVRPGVFGGLFQRDGKALLLSLPLASSAAPGITPVSDHLVSTGVPFIAPVHIGACAVSLDPSGCEPDAIHPLPNLPGGAYQMEQVNGRTVLSTVMDRAPWIHLDVPDGFIFYNTARTPVEVTVRVYGACVPNKTGFNLYYDAVGGMNNSPWQWIDVGPSRIYSYTVRLNDAIFADREGYDLRICMGGSTENLRVVDVTVKKVD
jgi:hypothetical protein